MTDGPKTTDTTGDNPMLDTGEAAREAVRMCRLIWNQMQEEKRQKQSQNEAVKRGVMQILKGIGWLK